MENDQNPSDPYEVVLADLRAQRDRIDAAIKAIEGIRSGLSATSAVNAPAATITGPLTTVKAGAFHQMSIVEATKELLRIRKTPLSNQQIVEGLQEGGMLFSSENPTNTVGSVLNRRFGQVGDVIRVRRGTWGLAEWFPNAQRFKQKVSASKGHQEGQPSGRVTSGESVDNNETSDSQHPESEADGVPPSSSDLSE